jgi:prevent-host-death family protein
MKQASVAALKARLSEYLAAVKRGEEVIVTDRGRPVARLAPIEGMAELDARSEALIRAGLARGPTAAFPEDFFDLPRPRDPEGRSLRGLLEEREEGW